MFGRNMFSLIILLTLGVIRNVLATDISLAACVNGFASVNDFTTCSSAASSPTTYCIKASDKKIYPVEDGACKEALDAGIHVFKRESDTEVAEIVLTKNFDPQKISKLIMYACSADGCAQTVGYAKITTYGTATEGQPSDFTENEVGYCKLTAGVCTSYTDGDSYSENAHPLTTGYYAITKSGGSAAGVGITCDSTKIGLYTSTPGLCLGLKSTDLEEAVSGAFGDFEYILRSTASGSIFSIPFGSHGILLKGSTKTIYHDNSPSGNTSKVVDTETYKVDTALTTDISSSPSILSLYSCNSGQCKRTYGYVQSENGYYSVSSDGVSEVFALKTTCYGFTGQLITGGKFCITQDDSESVDIASIAKNYILSDGETYKYVRGSTKTISYETLTGTIANGINIINKNTATVVTFPATDANLLSSLGGAITNAAMYYCNTSKKICSQTYGYIKTSDGSAKYYSIGTSTNAILTEVETCTAIGHVGAMSSEGVLCIHSSIKTVQFVSGDKKYQVKDTGAIASNPFKTGNDIDIVVEVGANAIFNNYYYSPLKLSEGLHLFELDSATKELKELSMSSPTITAETGLSLYTCSAVKCVKTSGFVKSGSNYYSIPLSSASSKKTAVDGATCDSSVGLLYTGYKLCIDEDETHVVDFETTATSYSNYVITPVAGNIFSGATNPILIKITQNAMSLNNIDGINSNNHVIKIGDAYKAFTYTATGTTFATAGDTGIKKLQKIDSGFFNEVTNYAGVSDDTSLVLSSCSSGTCTFVDGFIKETDDYFSLTTSSSAKLTSGDLIQCSAENAGKLTTDHQLCLGANQAIDFLSAGTAKYIIKVGTDFKLVEASQDQFIFTKLTGTMKSGINIVNLSTKKIIDYTTTDAASTALTTDITNLAIFDCESNNVCSQTYGFIKSNDADANNVKYYSFGTGTNPAAADAGFSADCGASDTGKIKSTGVLCVVGDGSSPITASMTPNKEYFVSTASASVFSSQVASKFVIVKATAISYTLKIVGSGYQILNVDGNKLVTSASNNNFKKTPGEVGIYKCENNVCGAIVGYAMNNGRYYKVSITNNLGVSEEYEVTNEVNSLKRSHCNGLNGLIVKDYEKKFLCLDDDISVELTSSNEGYHVLGDTLATGTPLTGGSKQMVYITDSYIVIETKYKANTSYVLKKENNYLYYSCDESNFTFGASTDGIVAYSKVNDKNIYKISDLSQTDGVNLFQCKAGICKTSKGYILVDKKLYGNSSGTWTEIQSESQVCKEAADAGKVKLSLNKDKIELCVPGATAGAAPTSTVVDDDIYVFGNDLQVYNAGSSNKIIGLPVPEDGYYYIAGHKVVTESATSLIYCKNKSCSETKVTSAAVGYYANAAGGKKIQCTSDGGSPPVISCALVDTQGYYLDINNTLVSCPSGTTCSSIPDPDYGYYVNAGDTVVNKYIRCTEVCRAIPAPTNACDSEEKSGRLTLVSIDVKLCLNNGISANTDGTYIVNFSSNSVFRDFVKSGQYGLIEISGTATSFTIKSGEAHLCVTDATLAKSSVYSGEPCGASTSEYICNADGVCRKGSVAPSRMEREEEESGSASNLKVECDVVTGKNCVSGMYYLIQKPEYTVIEEEYEKGTLFLCSNENEACQEVNQVGYFVIDKTAIFSCSFNEESIEIECEKYSLSDSESLTCYDENLGKILTNNSKFFICVTNSGTAIELNITNAGNYILAKNDEDIFGIGAKTYAIVNVNEHTITLNDKYNNSLGYVYANKSGNYKIIEKGTDSCPRVVASNNAIDTANIEELECTRGICDTAAA